MAILSGVSFIQKELSKLESYPPKKLSKITRLILPFFIDEKDFKWLTNTKKIEFWLLKCKLFE